MNEFATCLSLEIATEGTESTDPRNPAPEVVFPHPPQEVWVGGKSFRVGLGSVLTVFSVAI